ncbi:MAG: translesion error-prone DNA polymerase V autoproteolytic subunit [Thermosynechococcaceae cyanobacterium]
MNNVQYSLMSDSVATPSLQHNCAAVNAIAFDCSAPLHSDPFSLNLYQQPVSAGYPSPAEDYIEGKLDLNLHLIKNPAATFYVRVSGDSMTGAGIHNGDLLVVDRSLDAVSGRIVIAVLNGELTVKRLCVEDDRLVLKAENDDYPPIDVNEPQDLCIWGVATSVIHLL